MKVLKKQYSNYVSMDTIIYIVACIDRENPQGKSQGVEIGPRLSQQRTTTLKMSYCVSGCCLMPNE